MSSGGQRTKWHRNIAENLNRLSRVHERYRRQTDDRWMDDDIANVNMSSRSLKIRRTPLAALRSQYTDFSGLLA